MMMRMMMMMVMMEIVMMMIIKIIIMILKMIMKMKIMKRRRIDVRPVKKNHIKPEWNLRKGAQYISVYC